MSSIQLLTVGYPGYDVIMRTNRAPCVGETAIILDPPGIRPSTPGGCAPNVAVASSRLGVKTAPVIVVGDDEKGHAMLSYLANEGVDTSCVYLIAGGKTPRSFLFIDPEGGHQTYYLPGAADEPVDLDLPDAVFADLKYGIVTVGNSQHTHQFVDQMTSHDVPVVWSLRNDPHAFPQSLVEQLISAAQLLFMNQFEAEQLLVMLGLSGVDGLFELGVRTVVLTLGAKGSRILEPGRSLDVPAVPPATLVDPTGAGDGFVGGMMAGLCLGADIEDAARLGAVTASFVLEEWGCQTNLPGQKEAAERYAAAFGRAEFLGKGA